MGLKLIFWFFSCESVYFDFAVLLVFCFLYFDCSNIDQFSVHINKKCNWKYIIYGVIIITSCEIIWFFSVFTMAWSMLYSNNLVLKTSVYSSATSCCKNWKLCTFYWKDWTLLFTNFWWLIYNDSFGLQNIKPLMRWVKKKQLKIYGHVKNAVGQKKGRV